MDFKKFEEIVKIEFVESSNCYGHHPMQLAAINNKGECKNRSNSDSKAGASPDIKTEFNRTAKRS